MAVKPVFRNLTTAECRKLLRRNHVGRLAFTFNARVNLQPISYVYDRNWLYARTSSGTKQQLLRRNPWVAFAVDEIKGPFEWQSVVVHGTVYYLDDGTQTHAQRDRGVALLRRFTPTIYAEDDP